MSYRLIVFISFLTFWTTGLSGFHIDNVKFANTRPIRSSCINQDINKFFAPITQPLSGEKIATSPLSLLQAAKDTLYYIKNRRGTARQALETRQINSFITLQQVEETLKFIISIIEEDKKTGKFRILDPEFINENFDFVKWNADKKTALTNNIKIPSNGEIRLTNYVIYRVQGNTKKTAQCNCAIYQLLDQSIAKKFTKQQILSGVLENPAYKNKVKRLAWVSRENLEDLLLQGSTLVKMPNKSYKIFIVDTNNGISYKKNAPNSTKQQRYWFYREAKSNIQSIEAFKKRVMLRKKVIFAGDLTNIGVGKIIAIKHINPTTKKSEIQLGVLADTGGAFTNNLYQLDLFLGMYSDKKQLKKQQQQYPNSTQAYLLYKRS